MSSTLCTIVLRGVHPKLSIQRSSRLLEGSFTDVLTRTRKMLTIPGSFESSYTRTQHTAACFNENGSICPFVIPWSQRIVTMVQNPFNWGVGGFHQELDFKVPYFRITTFFARHLALACRCNFQTKRGWLKFPATVIPARGCTEEKTNAIVIRVPWPRYLLQAFSWHCMNGRKHIFEGLRHPFARILPNQVLPFDQGSRFCFTSDEDRSNKCSNHSRLTRSHFFFLNTIRRKPAKPTIAFHQRPASPP